MPRMSVSWLQVSGRGPDCVFSRFPDQEVRRMAVQWMDPMSHTELLDFLPQLVQVGLHPVLKGWWALHA